MTPSPYIESLTEQHGCSDYRWLDPSNIVVAQWVRMKCRFGCAEYGKNACCPPHTPTVAECTQFFREYRAALVLHFTTKVAAPEARHAWTRQINARLFSLERAVFLAGYRKAFQLFMDSCGLCKECAADRASCNNPARARPAPEAMAVDVFETVRPLGYPIDVLANYDEPMNRYAILLVE